MADELAVRPIAIEMTAYYCVQPPATAGAAPPRTLLALHGFGQKCRGFMRNFAPLADRNILVAAP
ncbi:MAG: hypothetical protein FJY92_08070, partial [Candidatus Hydrogenedentes bacterium]|nr:hypothetical protein [Candidatus Hydrogenedentota bacterium]